MAAGCAGTKKTTMENNILNGSWTPVKQEMGGNPLPPAFYEKQQLIISDTAYTLVAESVDRGLVKISGDKMDIYSKEGVNAGKHFTAIFKLDNGLLTICYNLKGDGYPAAFDTKGQPLYFLSVFKRAQ
jgi:uncharacterized protein (TIGR03067 family)